MIQRSSKSNPANDGSAKDNPVNDSSVNNAFANSDSAHAAVVGDRVSGRLGRKRSRSTAEHRTVEHRTAEHRTAEHRAGKNRVRGLFLQAGLGLFRLQAVLVIFLGAITVLASVGLLATSGELISQAARHPELTALSLLIVGVRFFGLTRSAVRYLERLIAHDLTFRLLERLRVWLYVRFESSRVLGYDSGDLLARVSSDVDTLQLAFLRAYAPIIVAALVSSVVVSLLALVSIPLALAVAGVFFIAGVVLPLLVRALTRSTQQALVAQRARLTGQFADGLRGAQDLLSNGAAHSLTRRLSGSAHELERRDLRLQRVLVLERAVAALLSQFALLVTFIVCLQLIVLGRLVPVHLAAISLGVLASFEALLPIGAALGRLEAVRAAGDRLSELAEMAVFVRDPLQPREFPRDTTLVFDRLSVRYPGANHRALDGLSCSLAAGHGLAVLGANGSGKTTLASSVLREIDPEAGSVSIGGVDLRELRLADLHAEVGLLAQHPQILSGTIAENLRLARPQASQLELEHVLEEVNLLELVRGLPQGLETRLGEFGHSFSGGERQRLAIARLLLQAPRLVVLDEPTNHLDRDHVRLVGEALAKLIRGRSFLLITHDLRLLEWLPVDELITLERGRMVGQGKADELERLGLL